MNSVVCSITVLQILIMILEGDQFKVYMGEKKIISNIDIEMYLTLLGNI